MKCENGWVRPLSALVGLLAFVVPSAHAEYIISFQQVGSDVVATGSGSFDLTALSSFAVGLGFAEVRANNGTVLLGPQSFKGTDNYHNASSPGSFGPGGVAVATVGTGPAVGVNVDSGPVISVPQFYISGTALDTSTATWTSQTFTTLGLTPGTYDYAWGTGIHADDLIVQIGPAATGVPLPPAACTGFLISGLAFAFRRKLICAA